MPEIENFDIKQFSLDVYEHRTGLNMSRKEYAKELGLFSCCPIQHIEIRKVAAPALVVAYNICKWMGKSLSEYFKENK